MSSKTSFPTRPLGQSGMDITRIGLGAWAIGGSGWAVGWGPQDDADSVAAIRRHQLDRYRGGVRPGAFRGDRAPRAGADGA